MTLSTAVRPLDPIDHRLVFVLARKVAGIPAEWPFTANDHVIRHEPGCPGARCRVDAFLWGWYDDERDGHEGWRVRFDSSGVPDALRLHARLVRALLKELAAVGVSAEWQDECTGQWFTAPPGRTIREVAA